MKKIQIVVLLLLLLINGCTQNSLNNQTIVIKETDSNNVLINERILNYDEKGELTRIEAITYASNGDIITTYIEEYTDGKLVKSSDNGFVSIYEYEDDLCIRSQKGSIVNEYAYNDMDQLISDTEFLDCTQKVATVYDYNCYGDRIYAKSLTDYTIEEIYWEYDDDKLIQIRQVTSDLEGGVKEVIETYEYAVINAEERIVTKHLNQQEGDVITAIVYEYHYDDNGILVSKKITNDQESYEYKFEYDNASKILEDEKCSEIVHRLIIN